MGDFSVASFLTPLYSADHHHDKLSPPPSLVPLNVWCKICTSSEGSPGYSRITSVLYNQFLYMLIKSIYIWPLVIGCCDHNTVAVKFPQCACESIAPKLGASGVGILLYIRCCCDVVAMATTLLVLSAPLGDTSVMKMLPHDNTYYFY